MFSSTYREILALLEHSYKSIVNVSRVKPRAKHAVDLYILIITGIAPVLVLIITGVAYI